MRASFWYFGRPCRFHIGLLSISILVPPAKSGGDIAMRPSVDLGFLTTVWEWIPSIRFRLLCIHSSTEIIFPTIIKKKPRDSYTGTRISLWTFEFSAQSCMYLILAASWVIISHEWCHTFLFNHIQSTPVISCPINLWKSLSRAYCLDPIGNTTLGLLSRHWDPFY